MRVRPLPLIALLVTPAMMLSGQRPQAAPPAPLPPPIVRAEKYALVVGVTGYPNFRETDRLQFADADARSFAQLLETDAAGAFKHDNIRLLVNQQATRTNIYKEMYWIGSRASSDDVVYVFFAGHGVSDDSGRAYFMPFDGDPVFPNALGMRADNFMQDLKDGISARQMIFFIDACHAAAVYSRAGSARRDAGNIIPQVRELWDRQLAGLQELNMAFLSASSNEFSIEDETLKHGIFTWYLIQGLGGQADENRDGEVTAGELRRYLARTVDTHARRKSAQQTPSFSPAFDGSRILAFTALPEQRPYPVSRAPGKMAAPPPKPSIAFTPRAKATFSRKLGDQNRYDFNIWIETSPADSARIEKVVYDFIVEGNPLRFESRDPIIFFKVAYEGWGCYRKVVATFFLRSPTEVFEAPPFDLCQVLGW